MQEYGLDTLKFIIFKFQYKGQRFFGVGFVLWFLLLFSKNKEQDLKACLFFWHMTINCHVKDGFICLFVFLIVGVRVSLRASRLIPREHEINDHVSLQ
jgi:hypothetical protein